MHRPPHPPPSAQPGRVPPRTAGGYARAYRRRRVIGFVLFGAALAVMVGNGATMIVAAEAEGPFGLFRGMAWARTVQAWADTVGVLALVAVPPLMGSALVYTMVNHWPPPDRIPPWTTPEDLRAAQALVRQGLIGSDARTGQVARAVSDALLAQAAFLPPPFRSAVVTVSVVCGALVVSVGLYGTVRSLLEEDLNGLATGVHTVLVFIGFLCLIPLASARQARARRYLALYDAAHRRAPRYG
ncbi:hypothetical protein ABZ234_06945 [Nocardiopsis sp. NPDC006198]|uniref:hypothetical protein n=1 Tax=Nocardiopsis sp. NPDC006198 TaxID=3154472 RepID=UPI0033B541FD